jgi:hypothetical protein
MFFADAGIESFILSLLGADNLFVSLYTVLSLTLLSPRASDLKLFYKTYCLVPFGLSYLKYELFKKLFFVFIIKFIYLPKIGKFIRFLIK